ncbi:hypothetical protein LCGC14_1608260 [marine sediment metagenome]|uniref:Uncharacterized protein n=1 Tax=marine sediment metagenome TaxID=412755 RepID=A0A0F9L9B0_9ZZZZ
MITHSENVTFMDWDYKHREVRQPIPNLEVVVSVRFKAEDFRRISMRAESLGVRTSEFIRMATERLMEEGR